MTEYLSKRMTQYLVNRLQIDQNESDLYELGMEVIVSTVITSISIFLVSFFLKNFAGAVFFLCCFITVRNYSGGFHAHTRAGCFAVSIVCYLASYGLSKALACFPLLIQALLIGVGLAVSAVVFGVCAPLENPNKRLKADWKRHNRRMMLFMMLFWLMLFGCLIRIGKCDWAAQIWATLVIIAVLLEMARRRDKDEKGKKNN